MDYAEDIGFRNGCGDFWLKLLLKTKKPFRALYLRTVVPYEAYSMMEVRWRNMIKNMFIREKIFSGITETDTLALLDTNLPILQIFVQVS